MATTATPPAEQKNPVFQIQRIYLKEASVEQPNSPKIFSESGETKLEIEIKLDSSRISDGFHEVIIGAQVKAVLNEKVSFIVEARQAAIFEMRNLPVNDMEPLLGIACPQILYPYLRASIADLVTRTGFPPVHLTEINFQQLYEQDKAQRAKQAEGKDAETPPPALKAGDKK